ncbi:MarR family transcriptional regulator [Actinomadura sp. CNU-125]|uniref:MarR family transcriptional regulator n=1 Tax=Actinomadura sp. CNU-125 TaxID=1904961 RepID=UPI000AE4440A|nr:helix-turn-helix domain-containing protein [Actinomadura sp. CNU-125]
MATKNTTAENRPTGTGGAVDGAAGAGAGVRPSGAAGAVWDALTANPGATVAAIVAGSGVGEARVRRLLSVLEGEGRAVRTRGGRDGGKRLPDIWTAVAPDTPDTGTEPDAAPAVPTVDASAVDVAAGEATAVPDGDAADRADVTGHTGATDRAATDTAAGVGGGLEIDEAAANEARDALALMNRTVTEVLHALDVGDPVAALSAVERVYGGSGKVRRLVRTAVNGRPRTGSGRVRSAPGEMRAKVAGHLTAHPGTGFTPHEIAKVIGHSAGAVSNALDRLVETGDAELVNDRPRRFTTVRPAAAPASR